MNLTPRSESLARWYEAELHVLFTRLSNPADRPLPTEEEIDDFEPVDADLDAVIRDHLELHLGAPNGTSHDTRGPVPIDVALTEPADRRPWGACCTVGASARAMPTADADSRDSSRHVELFLRLPKSAFRYWEAVVLEPFDDLFEAVIDALGELGRLPHEQRVGYRTPQIVATPDMSPLVAGLPFAGVLLRDASTGTVPVPELAMPGGGTVTFLTVTFLHPSEIRALSGPDRVRAATRLAKRGVDELLAPEREPVL